MQRQGWHLRQLRDWRQHLGLFRSGSGTEGFSVGGGGTGASPWVAAALGASPWVAAALGASLGWRWHLGLLRGWRWHWGFFGHCGGTGCFSRVAAALGALLRLYCKSRSRETDLYASHSVALVPVNVALFYDSTPSFPLLRLIYPTLKKFGLSTTTGPEWLLVT